MAGRIADIAYLAGYRIYCQIPDICPDTRYPAMDIRQDEIKPGCKLDVYWPASRYKKTGYPVYKLGVTYPDDLNPDPVRTSRFSLRAVFLKVGSGSGLS